MSEVGACDIHPVSTSCSRAQLFDYIFSSSGQSFPREGRGGDGERKWEGVDSASPNVGNLKEGYETC